MTPREIIIDERIRVPLSEIEFSYARSSGPGGQNVNKVNSKALMRWPVSTSLSIPDDVRARFLAAFSSRLTLDGDVLITSDRFRDQARNADDCIEKLREMLAQVARPPRVRKKTKPTRSSQRRRLESKRKHSTKKAHRRSHQD